MKSGFRYDLFILLFFTLDCIKIFAQQNLFNIPFGDIMIGNKLFYQQQINLNSATFESKARLALGLGKLGKVGVNVVGKTFDFSPVLKFEHKVASSKGAFYPIILGIAQKQIHVFETLEMALSGQGGFNMSEKVDNKQFNYSGSCLGVYHFLNGSCIVGGIYKTNNMYVGGGGTFGFMFFGDDLKLNKKIYLMGDRNDRI